MDDGYPQAAVPPLWTSDASDWSCVQIERVFPAVCCAVWRRQAQGAVTTSWWKEDGTCCNKLLYWSTLMQILSWDTAVLRVLLWHKGTPPCNDLSGGQGRRGSAVTTSCRVQSKSSRFWKKALDAQRQWAIEQESEKNVEIVSRG